MCQRKMLFSLICFAITLYAYSNAVPLYALPEIKFADLLSANEIVAENVVAPMLTIGAVQITGVPGFAKARLRALEDLAKCFEEENTAPSVVMADGAERRTAAAATTHGRAGEMNNICGDASKKLRGTVDSAMSLLFRTMDIAARRERSHGEVPVKVMNPTYSSYQDVMRDGAHLEHLHAYYAPTAAKGRDVFAASKHATLDYHVDSGLMIAMTTGLFSHSASEESGLYLRLPDNSEVKVDAQDDALLVLIGQGAQQWLAPVLGAPLRAAPHKMVADLSSSQSSSTRATRSWYGKMYLPPLASQLPSRGISFEEYNQRVIQSAPTVSSLLPIACESSVPWGQAGMHTTSRAMTANDDMCGVGEIYCWARCMSTADLPCGDSAICWNSDLQEISPGETHCSPGSACNPACMDDPNAKSNTTSYCFGSGTSMFMQGFVSIVQEPQGDTECVNLWFVDWTLDSKGKYAAACIGVFLLCLALQYMHTLRGSIGKVKDKRVRVVLTTFLYGVNVTAGYFVMLVAMTYSVELFCMVCVGMTLGYGIFMASTAHSSADTALDTALDSESVHQPLVQSTSSYQPPNPSAPPARSAEDSEEFGNCCGNIDNF